MIQQRFWNHFPCFFFLHFFFGVMLCWHKILKSPFMIGSMNIKLLEVSKTIKYSSRSAMQMGENFEPLGEGVEVK